MIGHLETLSSSQIIFNKLFPPGAQPWCAIYQPRQSVTLCWAKIIFLSQTGIFWLFSSNFHMLGQILSTTGDSLRGKFMDTSHALWECLWLLTHPFWVCQWVLRILLRIF
jgi:hypothetical protein